MVVLTNQKSHQNYVGNFARGSFETTNPQNFPSSEELPLIIPEMNFSGQGDPVGNENEEADDEMLCVKPMQF